MLCVCVPSFLTGQCFVFISVVYVNGLPNSKLCVILYPFLCQSITASSKGLLFHSIANAYTGYTVTNLSIQALNQTLVLFVSLLMGIALLTHVKFLALRNDYYQ